MEHKKTCHIPETEKNNSTTSAHSPCVWRCSQTRLVSRSQTSQPPFASHVCIPSVVLLPLFVLPHAVSSLGGSQVRVSDGVCVRRSYDEQTSALGSSAAASLMDSLRSRPSSTPMRRPAQRIPELNCFECVLVCLRSVVMPCLAAFFFFFDYLDVVCCLATEVNISSRVLVNAAIHARRL